MQKNQILVTTATYIVIIVIIIIISSSIIIIIIIIIIITANRQPYRPRSKRNQMGIRFQPQLRPKSLNRHRTRLLEFDRPRRVNVYHRRHTYRTRPARLYYGAPDNRGYENNR